MNFEGKKVLVVGAARSGIAAAKLLKRLGAQPVIADAKAPESLTAVIDEMKALDIPVLAGANAAEDVIAAQDLIVSSPGVPPGMETFRIARARNIPIMGEFELAFLNCPCPVLAITGTNGKTTTTALVGEICARYNPDTQVVGNIGRPFSDCLAGLTKESIVVAEASSFQLNEMQNFRPKVGAVLNVTRDHTDWHGGMENYILAKTNVFQHMDESGFVILNYDNEITRNFEITNGAKVYYFSVDTVLSEGAYLKDGQLVLDIGGRATALAAAGELKILGRHNIENALAAALITACAGIPAEMIAQGLKEFGGVAHRIEFVRTLDGVNYYNDSKGTNPDASIKALEAMKGKSVLIVGGHDKQSDFDPFTAMFAEKASRVIVLGETKEKIIESMEKIGYHRYTVAPDYPAAVRLAHDAAQPGENVLLSPACASWDMFKDYEQRGDCFKELVQKL